MCLMKVEFPLRWVQSIKQAISMIDLPNRVAIARLYTPSHFALYLFAFIVADLYDNNRARAHADIKNLLILRVSTHALDATLLLRDDAKVAIG